MEKGCAWLRSQMTLPEGDVNVRGFDTPGLRQAYTKKIVFPV